MLIQNLTIGHEMVVKRQEKGHGSLVSTSIRSFADQIALLLLSYSFIARSDLHQTDHALLPSPRTLKIEESKEIHSCLFRIVSQAYTTSDLGLIHNLFCCFAYLTSSTLPPNFHILKYVVHFTQDLARSKHDMSPKIINSGQPSKATPNCILFYCRNKCMYVR